LVLILSVSVTSFDCDGVMVSQIDKLSNVNSGQTVTVEEEEGITGNRAHS